MSLAALLGLDSDKKGKGSKKEQQIAKDIRHLYENISGGERIRWMDKSQQAFDFFLGDQLTATEIEELVSAGMPDFIINKITKSVEVLIYFLTNNNPRWIVTGREGSDVNIADVHNALLEYIWDISKGKSVLGQSLQDAIVKSLGYLFVDMDPDMDNGRGEVILKYLDRRDVYPDPASTDIMFDDAAFILIKKNLSKSVLKDKLPEYARIIDKATGNDERSESYSARNVSESQSIQSQDISFIVDMYGKEDPVIDYYERYTKIREKYVDVTIRNEISEENQKEIQRRVKEQVEKYAQKLEIQIEDESITLNDKLEKGEISQERAQFELKQIQEYAREQLEAAKNKYTSEAVNEISQTQNIVIKEEEFEAMQKSKAYKDRIVDSIDFWLTRINVAVTVGDSFLYEYQLPIEHYPIIPIPYIYTGTPFPISAVQMVVGKQREINKAHQIMIHNASLGSSLRWMYRTGAIDIPAWETTVSIPGGLLEVRPGHEFPVPVLPAPLATAFLEIIGKGGRELEEEIGALPQMMGEKAGETHETFRGLLAADEFGTRRIKSWMKNIVEPALERTGTVITALAQSIYTAPKVFRIVNPDTSAVESYEINTPIYNTYGNEIGKYFDLGSTKFDVRMVSGSTLPSNRWAKLDQYFEWFKAGVIDDIALIAESDISGKEQIIARNSLYAKLKGQIASMEEQLKQMKGSNETLTREVENVKIKEKVTEAGAEIGRALAKTKAELSASLTIHQQTMKAVQNEADAILNTLKSFSKNKVRDRNRRDNKPKLHP